MDPMPHGEEGGGKAAGKGRDIKGERGPSKHRGRQVHLASSCPWNTHEVQGEKQAGKELLAGKCLYLTGNHQASQENIRITQHITVATTLGTGGQGRRSRCRSQGAQHKVARGHSHALVPGAVCGISDALGVSPPLFIYWERSCCCSVTQSCLPLCDPLDGSTPGLPVLQCLLEFADSLDAGKD